jgi:carboxypeptidase family protein
MRRVVVTLVAVLAGIGGLVAPASAESSGIEGFVTNARTGEPVAGAWVEAYSSATGNSGGANTDASGHFDLYWLSPGREYRMRVIGIDYLDQWSFGKTGYDTADPVTSPGTASFAMTPLDYGSLSGRFVTTSGTPVAGGSVEVRDLNQNWVDSATTDADGAFRFGRLLARGYKLHFIGPTGISQYSGQKLSFDTADVLTVAPDTETTTTETAIDGGNMEVTVVDDVTGEPVPGAYVNADDPTNLEASEGGSTDANGRIVFTGILPTTYRLTITPPEGFRYGSVEEVVVRANETTTVTAPLTANSLLSITMRDAQTGAAVTGACVVVLDEQTHNVVRPDGVCADGQGKVQLDYYWPGRYRLFVYTTDGVHGSQWVGANGGTGDVEQAAWFELASHQTTDVPVQLDPAGSISGVVTSARNGAPVDGLCPSVTPVAPYSFTPVNTRCTGPDGRYTINNLGPYEWPVQFPDYTGTYAWTWSGGAADRLAAQAIGVRSGQAVTADASLPAGGTLTGHITGADLPLQFVYVVATNARTGDWAAPDAGIRTGAEYTLSGLATQQVRLEYQGKGGEDRVRHYPDPVDVVAGNTVVLDLPA